VVNASEGEPGSFKDRELLLRNPYRTLEGALVAASAIGANRVIVGMKKSFTDVALRVRSAIDELDAADWTSFATIEVFEGPSEYLLGEETALLESIDGRHPFPRVAPPYRRGVNEAGGVQHEGHADSASAARVELAGPTPESLGPPCLVNNVETLAHCALILANGAAWFRQLGTLDSPGSVVCTVSGHTIHAGVGEVPMGTPLAAVIHAIGGGARDGRRVKAVMQGVAAALITADLLDTPVSWEGMRAAGSALGSASFMVYADDTSMATIAASASRFLAVESCGQCLHCKRDGLAIANALERVRGTEAQKCDLDTIAENLITITDGARCSLAMQQQVVVGSILQHFGDELRAPAGDRRTGIETPPIAPIIGIHDGHASLDSSTTRKQPDWSFEGNWSGKLPAERFTRRERPDTRLAAPGGPKNAA
jgi:NADH:ubiquinone oxidoreductase subunit F (NADH-binding)